MKSRARSAEAPSWRENLSVGNFRLKVEATGLKFVARGRQSNAPLLTRSTNSASEATRSQSASG